MNDDVTAIRNAKPEDVAAFVKDYFGLLRFHGEVREVFSAPLLFTERDEYGKLVREAWVQWAEQQPNPKASWLVAWEELSEADKEADRCIGEALFNHFATTIREIVQTTGVDNIQEAKRGIGDNQRVHPPDDGGDAAGNGNSQPQLS